MVHMCRYDTIGIVHVAFHNNNIYIVLVLLDHANNVHI